MTQNIPEGYKPSGMYFVVKRIAYYISGIMIPNPLKKGGMLHDVA